MSKLPSLNSLGNPLGEKTVHNQEDKKKNIVNFEQKKINILSKEESEIEARYSSLLSKLNLKPSLTLEDAERIVESLGIRTFEEMECELENGNPFLMKINALFIQKILSKLSVNQEKLGDLEINSIEKYYEAIESGLINVDSYSGEELDNLFSSLLKQRKGDD